MNYTIRFRRGLDNLAADRLSRSATQYDMSVNDETEFFERHVYPVLEDTRTGIFSINSPAFTEKLLREQARDPIITDAIEQLNLTGRVEKGQLKKHSGLCLRNGLLYRRKRIVVPFPARRSVLDLIHNAFHGGINRTYEEVKCRFYWKGLYTDVVKTCESCTICVGNKTYKARRQLLRPIHTNYQFPRATVSYDVATLPWSNGGYRYVLIMIDLFSKYTEAVAMPDQEASTILTALERGWFYRHGFPITLLSDQGRNVDGSLIREACKKWGIRKIHSSPYHPQGDGEAERGIQTFKQTMRCLLAEKQMERTAWPDLYNK